jgi:hypothetical protein
VTNTNLTISIKRTIKNPDGTKATVGRQKH